MESPVAALIRSGNLGQRQEDSFTPDLQHSRYMSGESDNESAYPTPSDPTTAAQPVPHETWPISSNSKMIDGIPVRADEEVRKIHYIDSSADHAFLTPATKLEAPTAVATTTTMPSSSVGNVADVSHLQVAPTNQAASAAPTGASPISSATLPPCSSAAQNTGTAQGLTGNAAAVSSMPATDAAVCAADALPLRPVNMATSSAASTPASTPGATPQTYARKRGRPRKHPLPDPNAPPKSKRKLSPVRSAAAAAKKKATAAAAARSAASSAGSLLSVPDLGRLIPQGSTSDNAQNFIQNNLRLFADLFVALQKQAATDSPARNESLVLLTGATQENMQHALDAGQNEVSNSESTRTSVIDERPPEDMATSAREPTAAPSTLYADTGAGMANVGATSSTSAAPSNPISGPSDAIRDEIKKKMADVTKGREAIQAEILQMRVDASFFENAQKTVDERIVVLRDRIAKHTALLQREREATRQAREATRRAKKDRKAREKSLRDSEREERRLAQTFAQLEREIAAEEEERRRLEEVDSSDEEEDERPEEQRASVSGSQLPATETASLSASPTEATTVSATGTPSIGNEAAITPDRAIGFSDEELAKVLGISTSELAGFSQTLELTAGLPTSPTRTPLSSSAAQPDATPSTFASMLPSVTEASDSNADSFDVAAFLEIAGSFGSASDAITSELSATQQQG
ncbi:uncharacterized protein UMAG_11491 [Mycosarcoma maydis]|uniref:Uncharacterized protein n=1 Tax=Mycosarcoma maydis TaxID=5270 RepID=A0A0D1DXJ5_MYCMD|nr:uncharacterized protein UMAG_11491 [Ustilago maydis 521]KIS68889.1 hypothetical protein UMAG_11491 [Ustilago maydis 521]|eukprot:XP_011389549.1 hypothetical protein UMAG_11491 [Ustilago maydis 521]